MSEAALAVRGGATIRRVLWIYDRLVSAVVWLGLVPFTIAQIVRQTATFDDLSQRLGRATLPSPRGVRIVVHAVSAGEMTAAGALIAPLSDARPDWTVVITTGTRDGAALAGRLRARFPSIESVISLPWDRRRAVTRWLQSLHCSAFVVVEPEIWPNLYDACERMAVPLLLVNGHIYPRDVARYRLAKPFFRRALSLPRWIGVQSEAERDRFVAIGAPSDRVAVTGSVKFDVAATKYRGLLAEQIKGAAADRLTIIGGSTYGLEEHALLEALEQLHSPERPLRLILAPRYVTRARAVATTASSLGFRTVLGSALTDGTEPWQVLVVDRLGELAALYAEADVAFVGGTMVRRGGHNVLEPAACGRAIVVGPFTTHISDLVDGLAAAGAVVRLRDAESSTLVRAIERLLVDDEARGESGARARDYCLARVGAAEHSVRALIDCVERDAEAVKISARAPRPAPRVTWPLGANEAASSEASATPREGW